MTGTLGVAVVGAGFMGEIHAAALAKQEDARLRWVLDHSPKKARRLTRAYRSARSTAERGWPKTTESLEAILGDDQVDAVFVCTQPKAHAALAKECLRAGRAVFLEKPITWTVAEGRALLRLAPVKKGRLFVGHVCRFFPEYVQIRERVQAGDIGRPAMVRASRVMGSPGGWYTDPQRSLGVAGDLLLHDFDLALWMFGAAQRVYALSQARRPPIEEQHVLASVRHKDGTISHLEGSWAHVDGFRTRFEVSGSEGVLEFDSSRRAPLLWKQNASGRGKNLVVPESPSHDSPYDLEVRHFLDVVLGRCRPRITAAEAVQSLELALAAAQSAKLGKPITLAAARSPR
jgi:predicted dehydrogenase